MRNLLIPGSKAMGKDAMEYIGRFVRPSVFVFLSDQRTNIYVL